ncbi:MAG: hypothetical protein KatS3mg054_1225 [Chloroflexus sp.]|jgi:hypothetical protein|nr:MAG: hypothetical protein KatS3mg054_1225 [Chloroflexus sp.]
MNNSERVVSRTKVLPLEGAPETLLHILKTESRVDIRQAALLGLAAHHPKSRQLTEGLAIALQQPPLDVVALGLIASLRCSEFLPQVKQIVSQEPHHGVYTLAAAIRAWVDLAALEDSAELEQLLKHFLEHPHLAVRAEAARGLAKMNNAVGIAVLEHLIKSPVIKDRRFALAALQELAAPQAVELLFKSMQAASEGMDTTSLWEYRGAVLGILPRYSLTKYHWRILRRLAHQWNRESKMHYEGLVRALQKRLEESERLAGAEGGRMSTNEYCCLRRITHIFSALDAASKLNDGSSPIEPY